MTKVGATFDEAISHRLTERLQKNGDIAAAYLLGSAVRDELRPDSDIDIALLPVRGRVISSGDRLSLAADLEEIAGRPVDVGVLSTANLVYAKEAVAHGTVIFERDHAARARFAMLVLSMYAALQESRREVLHAYAA